MLSPDRGPSLDGFIAWLEKQRKGERYIWECPQECACAQYAKDIGWFTHWVSAYNTHFTEEWGQTWEVLNAISERSQTFGGLLRSTKYLRQRFGERVEEVIMRELAPARRGSQVSLSS